MKDNALIENDLVTCLMDKTDKLYHALRSLVFLHGCEQEGLESGMPTPEQWEQAVDAAHRALKEASMDGLREKTPCCNWRYIFAQRSFWKTECGNIADDPAGDFCQHCGRTIKRSES